MCSCFCFYICMRVAEAYAGANVCLYVQCVCKGLTPVSEEAQCGRFSVECVLLCVYVCVKGLTVISEAAKGDLASVIILLT